MICAGAQETQKEKRLPDLHVEEGSRFLMCVPMQPLFVIRVVVTPALKLTLATSAGTDVESERHDAHQHGDYGQDECK